MFGLPTHLKHIIVSVLFLAVWILNAFFLHHAILGGALLIVFLLIVGNFFGIAIARHEHPVLSTWIGVWMLLSGIAIVGSGIYYVAVLTPTVMHILVLLAFPIGMWAARHGRTTRWFSRAHDLWHSDDHTTPATMWILLTLCVLLLVSLFSLIARSATTEAIRSLWLVVPPAVFIAVFFLSLLIAAHLWRGRERALSLPLVSATLFFMVATALLVFPIGYGFDSFIHQATERWIAEFGTITPKPFYYIGQYALVLFAHHAFSLPVDTVDRLLVPILTALLLPLAWYSAAAHLSPSRRTAATTLLALFLIPLSSFIVTTPQGLANLWTLLLILAAVPYLMRAEGPRVYALAIPALAALCIHPIAGIPAVLFVALLACEPRLTNHRLQPVARGLFVLIAIAGCVVLPASFVANSVLSGSAPQINLAGLAPTSLLAAVHADLFFENRFNPLLDLAYLYGFNAIAIVVILALVGWWMRRREEAPALRVYLVMAAMLFVNFLLLSTAVDFSFLIDYERQGYAERMIPLMTFFLAPLLILAMARIATRLHTAPTPLQIGAVVLIAAMLTSAWYFTYPRHDSYAASRGFNVSAADIDTVYAIDRDALGEPYIVLANQSVAAAAMHQFGFAHYYGDLFYYPIPTGGEMYDLFLTMNEQPSRNVTEDALRLINSTCASHASCDSEPVLTVYYVVNDYWWESDRLVETGKQTADAWFSIDEGRVHVFKYKGGD